jgi:DNA-binding CsgD family transcriptional regulator
VTRGVAALLALRTGDLAAGRAHLTRARELTPRTSRAGDILEPIEIEAEGYHLGHPRKALSYAAQLMPETRRLDPRGGDALLVMAARSACVLAEAPGARDEAVALLDRIERLRGQEPPPFEFMVPGDVMHPARRALFAADRAQCHGETDTARLWQVAMSACAEAGMTWHEALASYQLARALLAERGRRAGVATALRHARQIATDLGAAPIRRDCEELASQVHISLDEPALALVDSGDGDVLGSLTAREREVLSHLVAGRTYAEIAEALFISEKTVSVHVSNLLRKTGTRSRIELADLVRRTSDTL